MATEKQVKFIERLMTEREHTEVLRGQDPNTLTVNDASFVIKMLLQAPRRAQAEPLEPGVYENDQGVFVVKPNREGTRLYAKRMVAIRSERLTEAGTVESIEFEYAPGAMAHLKPEHRMSLERAQELTLRYGRCINCGRRLKKAQSVLQGIGPVCIKRFAA